MLVPLPPDKIRTLSAEFRFRNLIVVALFINKDTITEDGSVYFPEPQFPFTRVSEPKNRSRHMSPSGKTSLHIEIPCFSSDELWKAEDRALVRDISAHFSKLGWIRKEDIMDDQVIRLPWAYPILEVGSERKTQKLREYLEGFRNLRLSERNGRFLYAHIHDVVRFGKDIIEELALSQE